MMIGRAHSEQGDPTSMSPDRADERSDEETGAVSLASLVDVGAWEVGLADYAAPVPNPVIAPDLLDGLLSDALFGEVIDISDLIPRVMSPSAEALAPQQPAVEMAAAMEFGMQDGSDVLASHAAALTILYDDDILALDGTIL